LSGAKTNRKKKRHPDAVYKRRRIVLYCCVAAVILIPAVLLGKKLMAGDAITPTDAPAKEQTTTTAAATTTTSSADITTTTTTTEPPFALPDSHQLEVKAVLQNPELPTGCEVTSLTTLLNYLGYDVTKIELTNKYLPCTSNGGVTFDEYFVGSPYDENSFGCYAPVIARTAEAYFDAVNETDRTIKNVTGAEFEDMLIHVAKGNPVVIWATIDLHEPVKKYYWDTPDGTPVYFYGYEHCMVLTGYDLNKNLVYVSDPQKGNVSYDLERFKLRYEQLGSQGVIIY